MGDLARAIVDLGKAAEGRRGARRQVQEATNIVAHQIRALLRTGDGVTIPPSAGSKIGARYEALKVKWTDQRDGSRDAEVLARGMAILEDIDAKPKGAIVRAAPTTQFQVFNEMHIATVEERLRFIEEADEVVDKFRELLAEEASRYHAAAAKATKVVPR